MNYKLNTVFLVGLCCIAGIAQQKRSKLTEKFSVSDDVTIRLNTSHTNVVFETWDRNTVSVEAYLEGENISEEIGQQIMDSWQVDVIGNNKEVIINSIYNPLSNKAIASSRKQIENDLQRLQILGPMITDMLGPIMENISNNPMPNALTENSSNVNLNTGDYQTKEEKYVKQWESQLGGQLNGDFKNEIVNWGKELERNGNKVSTKMEIGVDAWGRQYVRQMEIWASQFAQNLENHIQGSNITVYRYNTNTSRKALSIGKKKIKVYLPQSAGLRLNIRHGDVQLAEKSNNIKASLSHTRLAANVIDGAGTYIEASYSPIFVNQWNNGRLIINYVKHCKIENAKNLMINSDSSTILINQLDENAAITGSFGEITIANLGNSFSTLDLAVVNSDFKLQLPNTPFNINYNGAQSVISLPKTLKTNVRRNFGNVFVNGYQTTRNTEKIITINAKYSEILLQ